MNIYRLLSLWVDWNIIVKNYVNFSTISRSYENQMQRNQQKVKQMFHRKWVYEEETNEREFTLNSLQISELSLLFFCLNQFKEFLIMFFFVLDKYHLTMVMLSCIHTHEPSLAHTPCNSLLFLHIEGRSHSHSLPK